MKTCIISTLKMLEITRVARTIVSQPVSQFEMGKLIVQCKYTAKPTVNWNRLDAVCSVFFSSSCSSSIHHRAERNNLTHWWLFVKYLKLSLVVDGSFLGAKRMHCCGWLQNSQCKRFTLPCVERWHSNVVWNACRHTWKCQKLYIFFPLNSPINVWTCHWNALICNNEIVQCKNIPKWKP